jgi:hypothetical protein
MPVMNRLPLWGRTLTLFLALLLLLGSTFSLAHCYGEHGHSNSAGTCVLCAFACHVAVVFLSIVISSHLILVCRFRQRSLGPAPFGTILSTKLIRAPPLLPSMA